MRMLERIRYVLGMESRRGASTLWPLGLMLTSVLVWGLVTVPTVPLNAAPESDETAGAAKGAGELSAAVFGGELSGGASRAAVGTIGAATTGAGITGAGSTGAGITGAGE